MCHVVTLRESVLSANAWDERLPHSCALPGFPCPPPPAPSRVSFSVADNSSPACLPSSDRCLGLIGCRALTILTDQPAFHLLGMAFFGNVLQGMSHNITKQRPTLFNLQVSRPGSATVLRTRTPTLATFTTVPFCTHTPRPLLGHQTRQDEANDEAKVVFEYGHATFFPLLVVHCVQEYFSGWDKDFAKGLEKKGE